MHFCNLLIIKTKFKGYFEGSRNVTLWPLKLRFKGHEDYSREP